jgi:hypothetical protein
MKTDAESEKFFEAAKTAITALAFAREELNGFPSPEGFVKIIREGNEQQILALMGAVGGALNFVHVMTESVVESLEEKIAEHVAKN